MIVIILKYKEKKSECEKQKKDIYNTVRRKKKEKYIINNIFYQIEQKEGYKKQTGNNKKKYGTLTHIQYKNELKSNI